jgi:glycosyltransferase involved in cell wall biosynthesis
MVIIEAMACGLAVVSFDCPYGPRSIIADGEDGILVEAENTDKLAEALSSVMGSPEKCHLLATNAIQNVKRFQMDEIANQWKQLFESIV